MPTIPRVVQLAQACPTRRDVGRRMHGEITVTDRGRDVKARRVVPRGDRRHGHRGPVPKLLAEGLDGPRVALDLDDDATRVIADDPMQPVSNREAIDERTEADALHEAADDEPASADRTRPMYGDLTAHPWPPRELTWSDCTWTARAGQI